MNDKGIKIVSTVRPKKTCTNMETLKKKFITLRTVWKDFLSSFLRPSWVFETTAHVLNWTYNVWYVLNVKKVVNITHGAFEVFSESKFRLTQPIQQSLEKCSFKHTPDWNKINIMYNTWKPPCRHLAVTLDQIIGHGLQAIKITGIKIDIIYQWWRRRPERISTKRRSTLKYVERHS